MQVITTAVSLVQNEGTKEGASGEWTIGRCYPSPTGCVALIDRYIVTSGAAFSFGLTRKTPCRTEGPEPCDPAIRSLWGFEPNVNTFPVREQQPGRTNKECR